MSIASGDSYGKSHSSVSSSLFSVDTLTKQTSHQRRTSLKSEKRLTPYYIRWSYFRNKDVMMLNLTTDSRPLIFYASAHIGVFYNYRKNRMRLVQGHRNFITSMSVDSSGRWIVTADAGEKDNAIIIWDKETLLPVYTKFDPYSDCGTRLVGISPDAKYIVSVSKAESQVIAIWCWTLGKDEPEGTFTLPEGTDKMKRIEFSIDNPTYFVITSENCAAFGEWKEKKLNIYLPTFCHKIGKLTDTAYLQGTHLVYTGSNSGHVIIWSDVSYTNSFNNDPEIVTNNKLMVKIIRLESHGIHLLKTNSNTIITANSESIVSYYDPTLKLLYWYSFAEIGSFYEIHFNVTSRIFWDLYNLQTLKEVTSNAEITESIYEDRRTFNEERAKELKDATLECNHFTVEEFIATTKIGGQIVLIDLQKKEFTYILHENDSYITAMDTHKEATYLCVGNSKGHLYLFNYQSKDLLNDNEVFPVAINCLKYAPNGVFIACGMADGSVVPVDPSQLSPIVTPHPLKVGSSAVLKVIFTDDSKYLALYDAARRVAVFKCHYEEEIKLVLVGRVCSHYKPILDIMFLKPRNCSGVRLFTLGEDRLLVEYDLSKAREDLKMLNCERIEQSAIPLCMAVHPKIGSEIFILIANSEHKFKLLNTTTKLCRKTTLGPASGTPVSSMHIVTLKKAYTLNTYIMFHSKKEIGMVLLPLDGNPHKSLSMVGHPRKITNMCASVDKNYVFTIGENDGSVLMWAVNSRAVDTTHRLGGEDLEPYFCLIEGGEDGDLFKEMQDLFYLTQIRSQGVQKVKPYVITNKIHLCEVANLMRAMGYYPSEQEVENIISEIKYAEFSDSGEPRTSIEFDDYVILYLNHRPSFGIFIQELRNAFSTFAYDTLESGEPVVIRDKFMEMLQERGECFSRAQIHTYFTTLLPVLYEHVGSYDDGDKYSMSFLPYEFGFIQFINDILGSDVFSLFPDHMIYLNKPENE